MTPQDEQHLDEQGRGLRRLARALVGDPAAADDVVQEAYVVALRRDKLGAAAWLRGVVRNKVRERRRAEARRAAHERQAPPSVAPDRAAATAAQIDEQRRVMVALGRVPEPFRTAVWLRFLGGHDPKAIAAALGVPAATVRTRIHRGVEHLREQLDAEHGGDRKAWTVLLGPLAFPRLPAAPSTPGPAGPKLGLTATIASVAAVGVVAVGLLALSGVFSASESSAPAGAAPAPVAVTAPGLTGFGGRDRGDGTPARTAEAAHVVLRGHVRAAAGRLPDALQVYVIRKDAQFHTRPLAHVAPDSDGRFELEAPAVSGHWIAAVSSDGASFGAVDGNTWSPEQPLTIHLAQAAERTVRVFDRAGVLIPNALVWFHPAADDVRRAWPRPGDARMVTFTDVTDERGELRVRVPTEGAFRLRIRDRGPLAERLVGPGEREVDFRLEQGGTVRLRLEGWARAHPAFEGRLENVEDAGALQRIGRFENGTLVFASVPRGRWRVHATARAYRTTTTEVATVSRAGEVVELRTEIRARHDIGSIAVELVHADGKPVYGIFANARAWLRRRTMRGAPWILRRPDGDSGNQAFFRGLESGTYDLFIAVGWYGEWIAGVASEIRVAPNQELLVRLEFHPAHRRRIPDLGRVGVAHRRLVHARLGALPIIVSRNRRTHPDDGLPLEGTAIGPYPAGDVALELWNAQGARRIVPLPAAR